MLVSPRCRERERDGAHREASPQAEGGIGSHDGASSTRRTRRSKIHRRHGHVRGRASHNGGEESAPEHAGAAGAIRH